ncbi:MAG: glycosyltransferase family 39 protein [Acidobacteria bacterium]|nr:glycosyltransferase family 39 protein [Acidobacteriota bacterium]
MTTAINHAALPPSTDRARRLILVAVVLGLILRLGFGLTYWLGRPLTHDEREYLALAKNLASGRGFAYDTPPVREDELPPEQFGRVPVYPLFVAAVVGRGALERDPQSTPAPLKIVQAFLGALGVWIVSGLARRVAGRRAGVAAAFLTAVYPPLVWICAYALSETLYSVLALAAAALLGPAVDRELDRHRSSVAPVAAAGILTGAAILTRPATIYFVLLVVAWLGWHRAWRPGVAFAAATLLVLAPWTVRNVRQYERVVLVSSQGGITFWTGNNPLARGEGDMAANPEIKRADIELRRRHPGLTAEQLEPIYYREALAYIAAHPVDWSWLLVRKFFYVWVPIGPSYRLHSMRYYAASVLAYGVTLPLAVAGFLKMWRAKRRPVTLWLLAGSAVLVCLVYFPQERFRIPIIDPTLIVCAAARFGRA